MNIIKQIAALWVQYRQFHSTYAELSHLSDAELRGMGLYRGDIVNIAYGEAEKRAIQTLVSGGKSAGHGWGGFGELKQSH
jgi:uncharacterized protein YjiS (DUF1127 family)